MDFMSEGELCLLRAQRQGDHTEGNGEPGNRENPLWICFHSKCLSF
jgi:hypothetical protein